MLVCIGVSSLTLADANARQLNECCGASSSMPLPLATADSSANSSSDLHPATSHSLAAFFAGGWTPLLSAAMTGVDARWLIGIGMLSCTLFMLAALGHFQDGTYKKYGRVWRGQSSKRTGRMQARNARSVAHTILLSGCCSSATPLIQR